MGIEMFGLLLPVGNQRFYLFCNVLLGCWNVSDVIALKMENTEKFYPKQI